MLGALALLLVSANLAQTPVATVAAPQTMVVRVPVANVWKTVVDRVGMKLPDDFQGGLASGVVKELV